MGLFSPLREPGASPATMLRLAKDRCVAACDLASRGLLSTDHLKHIVESALELNAAKTAPLVVDLLRDSKGAAWQDDAWLSAVGLRMLAVEPRAFDLVDTRHPAAVLKQPLPPAPPIVDYVARLDRRAHRDELCGLLLRWLDDAATPHSTLSPDTLETVLAVLEDLRAPVSLAPSALTSAADALRPLLVRHVLAQAVLLRDAAADMVDLAHAARLGPALSVQLKLAALLSAAAPVAAAPGADVDDIVLDGLVSGDAASVALACRLIRHYPSGSSSPAVARALVGDVLRAMPQQALAILPALPEAHLPPAAELDAALARVLGSDVALNDASVASALRMARGPREGLKALVVAGLARAGRSPVVATEVLRVLDADARAPWTLDALVGLMRGCPAARPACQGVLARWLANEDARPSLRQWASIAAHLDWSSDAAHAGSIAHALALAACARAEERAESGKVRTGPSLDECLVRAAVVRALPHRSAVADELWWSLCAAAAQLSPFTLADDTFKSILSNAVAKPPEQPHERSLFCMFVAFSALEVPARAEAVIASKLHDVVLGWLIDADGELAVNIANAIGALFTSPDSTDEHRLALVAALFAGAKSHAGLRAAIMLHRDDAVFRGMMMRVLDELIQYVDTDLKKVAQRVQEGSPVSLEHGEVVHDTFLQAGFELMDSSSLLKLYRILLMGHAAAFGRGDLPLDADQ